VWLRELVEELGVPPLGRYGLGAAHVAEVVQKSKRASSMQGNPIALTDDELARTLEAAI
jgi:alcohol dehydrogenase class IV